MAIDPYNDDEASADASSSGARIVVVDDSPLHSGALLSEVLASCQLRPLHVPRGSRVNRESGDSAIALVALPPQPAQHPRALEDVRHLKEEGHTVLCHAAGGNRWPLGVQCRALIAGAVHLFDSSHASFARELRSRLLELRGAELDAARKTRHLKEQMLNLGFVGTSPQMTGMFQSIVGLSAVSDVPVLIVGETGTGKELAARAIHRLDARRCDRPFVPVNCGAISSGLVESELFGHRRGAFTGAEHERLGLIRTARGGVLFLDEIGDLEMSLQGKLLRVLQERRVLAVGDDREVPVDVRVIAATNRDLEAMVRNHEFRADLFHRLNVLSIRVPALRDRPDDIEPLVQHFLAECTRHDRQPSVSASREFLDALRRVELPGNVRQLQNVVRRALVTPGSDDQLRLGNLPPELWQELSRTVDTSESGDASDEGSAKADRSSPVDAVAVLDAASWKLERALDLCEQQLVAAALGASSGNRSRAARLLGISPRCIFNKMRKHRLTA